ncbi:MAG: PEP-CTERM sorting domain-containing protein [Planctomycetales bacterium]|nr:PEP-CTERM sorting domain-containing protein [Planctomycetales bacterium]MCA9171044.1 PEP-CTERM sorting domain-containing protein [Planctomycetales bacterium]
MRFVSSIAILLAIAGGCQADVVTATITGHDDITNVDLWLRYDDVTFTVFASGGLLTGLNPNGNVGARDIVDDPYVERIGICPIGDLTCGGTFLAGVSWPGELPGQMSIDTDMLSIWFHGDIQDAILSNNYYEVSFPLRLTIIPEPSSVTMLLFGVGCLALMLRTREDRSTVI